MREYARISPKFWIGETGTAIRELGAQAQLVALYLMSSPHSNMIGMYWQPLSYIAEEVGLTAQAVEKTMISLIDIGFCCYDLQTKVVWIKEMAKYQIGERLDAKDKQSKGVQNAYNDVPGNPFLRDFFEMYSEALNMTHARTYEGASKPLAGTSEASKAQAQEKARAKAQAQAAADTSPTVMQIPLVGGEPHAITQARIDFWKPLYPAVDIVQELRKMAGWCSAHEERRKTAKGIEKFITAWLAKAQDQGGSSPRLTLIHGGAGVAPAAGRAGRQAAALNELDEIIRDNLGQPGPNEGGANAADNDFIDVPARRVD